MTADATQPSTAAAAPQGRATVHASGLDPMRYIVGTTITAILGAGLLAAVLSLFNDPTWWRGYAAGVVAGLVALVASAVPLTLLFSRPLAVVMNAFLLAGGIRAAALGGIVVLTVRAGGYPQNPTVACAAVMYTFIVIGEGLLLWSMIANSSLSVTRDAPSTPTTDVAPTIRELS